MKIEQALQLKPGETVQCPEDRGNKAFRAIVSSVGTEVYTSIHGTEYIWISVRELGSVNNSGGVWPSNRLSK